MPPKAQAKKSTGGKATGGGRGSGRTGTRGDSTRQKTTVFKTNSIGNSIGQATARSITMEVENRAGEGYPAQSLLKMFFFPLQRAKLIAFLKQEEPAAMQSGWDWQENTKSTAPNAQIVSLLTLMAANNNSSGLTPDMLPVLLQSFGLPVPASHIYFLRLLRFFFHCFSYFGFADCRSGLTNPSGCYCSSHGT